MLRGRLAPLFQVRPGEGRLVALLMALMFLPSAGGAIGSPGVEALFYARYGVQYLPAMYVALGLITLFTSLVLTAMLGRVSRKRLYLVLPAAMAAALVAARLLVALRLAWFYPVLWLGMYLLWTLQGLLTWGLAGTVCNARQAKRLFPLFGAGGILGIALGGLATRGLVAVAGTENLLLVWAAALGVTLAIVHVLTRDLPEARLRARRRLAPLTEDLQRGFHFVRRSPLMRWIAAGAMLMSILLFSIAFPFSATVARQFPTEDALTGFLGLFQGLTTAAAFLAALLAANRLYAWAGFMAALLALPLIYAGGFGLLLIANTFTVLVLFRFIQMAWLQGVFTTAYQAVFNVVPPDWREQTRTFIDGVPIQTGAIVVGLALSMAGPRLQSWHLYLGGLLIALLAAAVFWRARQVYGQALAEALRAGQAQMFLSEQRPFGGLPRDAAAVQALIKGVADADPVVRRVAAEILGSAAVPEAISATVHALGDPDMQVRQAALRSLAQAQAAPALLEVAALLTDPEPEVREQAVDTLNRLTGFPRGLAQHLRPLLQDTHPAVRSRAAVAVLRGGNDPEAAAAIRHLAAAVEADSRALAMTALADWGEPSTYDLAALGLADPSPLVRRAAVLAVARIDSERCLAPLVQALGDDDTVVRGRVADALADLGPRAQAAVLAALNDPRLEAGALRALEQMPLSNCRDALQAYVRSKVSLAEQYQAWQQSLREFEPDDDRLRLLRDSLRLAARQQGLYAVHAFGLLADPAAAPAVLLGLQSQDAGQQANALETIDNWPGRDGLRPVLAFWDGAAETAAPGGSPPPALETLTPLLHDSDAWLRACAALVARGHADASLEGQLARLAESDTDAFVRETAAAALPHGLEVDAVHGGPSMDTLATLSIMDRILFLKRVPLFSTLPPAELKQVAAIAIEQYYLHGDSITRQGEPGDEMYIIVSGQVKVMAASVSGPDAELARRGPGDYVGEMAIISQEPRSATLVAEGDTRVLCIESTRFEAILRERPEASLAVMRMLISRLKEVQGLGLASGG